MMDIFLAMVSLIGNTVASPVWWDWLPQQPWAIDSVGQFPGGGRI